MIGRRAFLAGSALAVLGAPLARGQARPKVLSFPGNLPGRYDIFRAAMSERGYVEGRDFIARLGTGAGLERYQDDVRAGADVILAVAENTRLAAQATASVPIVAVLLGLPAASELVGPNFARPAGNVTGIGSGAEGVNVKLFELAREIAPDADVIGVLSLPVNAVGARKVAEEASRAMGFRIVQAEWDGGGQAGEFRPAFDVFTREGVRVMVLIGGWSGTNATAAGRTADLLALSTAHRIPVIYNRREVVEMGGLISYGTDPRDDYERAAYFVDRILRGTKVADLPFEQDVSYRLVVNLGAARAQGLEIPAHVVARADTVIE
jgi:putative ABC transport system substrate-binding protein